VQVRFTPSLGVMRPVCAHLNFMATEATNPATGGKLTPEQKQTLLLIQQSGYSAEQLTQLLYYVGGAELPEFVTDLNNLLDDYLSQVDQVSGPELAALSKLHSFTRMLDSVLHHQ